MPDQHSEVRLKIYILDAFHEAGVALAREHAEVVSWPDSAIERWPEEADGVMVRMRSITAAEIARARQVRVICKQGVGYDTIDLEAARARGIPVLTTPGVNSEAVAEMAFALALTVARRTARFDRMLRAGAEIVRPRHLGVQLQGKTVGVVGMGNIGSAVARKWQGAFDARLVAFDPHAPADRWPDLPHRRVASLAELLASSDVVTLHLPLTEQSRGMIGSAELALMKRDAILINVSRGGIIDERALFDAMSAGHLFGAGLDVFEVEPPPADHPLLQLENLVATPHAAGGTHETQERSALQVARQVIEVLQGLPPRHRVA
jgi:D-3-phosphoglycerate dehydrogenase